MRHYWSNVEGVEPRVTPTPWITGGALHEGLEQFYRGKNVDRMNQSALNYFRKRLNGTEEFLTPEQLEDIEKQKAMVLGMLRSYPRIYSSDLKKWQILEGPEQEFYIPIIHPETKKEHPRFVYGGRIDLPIRPKNSKNAWVVEHKTASQLDESYYDRVSMDNQMTGYMLGMRSLFKIPVEGVIYNIILKTKIRQKKDESLPQFYARLGKEYEQSEPEKYYRREEFYRSKAEIEKFYRDLWHVAADLEEATKHSRWYGDETQCSSFFGKCRFIPLCSLLAKGESLAPIMKFFRKKEQTSEELSGSADIDY
jgi:hypothetical protein